MSRRSQIRYWIFIQGLALVFVGFTSSSLAALQQIGVLLTPDGTGRYSVVEIGDGFVPRALNSQGHVVGYTTNTDLYQPFFWTQAGGAELLEPYQTEPSAVACGINDLDQIAGESYAAPYNLGRAVLWQSPTDIKDLGTLGGQGAAAAAINNDGVVVGASRLPGSSKLQPFIWSEADAMRWLGSLDGAQAEGNANDISNSGQVVGWSRTSDGRTSAFFWTESTGMLDIGKFLTDGTRISVPVAVNDNGMTVGYFRGDDPSTKAFAWTAADGIEYLEALAGDCRAYGVNNSGTVVGTSGTLLLEGDWKQHAVIWQNSVATDLNELLSSELDYKLTYARAINDSGQIIAVSDRAYIPEPLTLLLLGMGALILRRRRTIQ